MTQELAQLANKDTPRDVIVPGTWPGLAAWALGRFGIGVVFAVMAWGLYQDQRADYERMISLIEAQARINSEYLAAINALTQRIEESIVINRGSLKQ